MKKVFVLFNLLHRIELSSYHKAFRLALNIPIRRDEWSRDKEFVYKFSCYMGKDIVT